MNVLNLGKLPDQQSMLVFHALARMGYEGLVTVSPSSPLVSIGYFQDAEKEIDIQACNKMGIPYMRREVGGGATYLDENQVFYQVIWNKNNSKFPKKIDEIFRLLSQAPIDTYREFGIDTKFHGENDIITSSGKKIAGEAGGDIENSMVFVGGILMDFNYEMMPKLLNVPDEKYRFKISKSLEENLTTMKRELGELPDRNEVVRVLNKSFESILGKLNNIELSSDILNKMVELEKWFNSPEFTYRKTPKLPHGVKIKDGVEILYGIYKARGGLIRNVQEVENNILKEVDFSGDFQLFPKASIDLLGKTAEKSHRNRDELTERFNDMFNDNDIQSPGVTSEDLVESIFSAK